MDEVATTHESVSAGATLGSGLKGNLGVFELTMTVLAVVLIFDLAVLFKGTPSGAYDFAPFSIAALFSGNPGIGIMNALARYFYSFGVDGVLPEHFGRTHDKHGSPAHGSLLQSATAIVLVMPYAVFDRDPVLELYAFTIGIGTMAMLLLLAISSVSIFVYLVREPGDENLWNRRIAPIGGVIGLLVIAAYATVNFNQFVDTSPLVTNACLVFVYGAFLSGLFLAMRWRKLRPDLYARIGRDS